MRMSSWKCGAWCMAAFAGAAIWSMTGCTKQAEPRQPITETRQLDADEIPPLKDMTTAERLGMSGSMPSGHPPLDGPSSMPTAAGSSSSELAWTTPPGWTELPATQFRNANFQVADNPEVECYLTVLPGDAGGLLPNLNRWRAQMGAEPLSEADAAALPTKDLLGEAGVYMTVSGAYRGMGQQPPKDGYMMASLAAIHGGSAYFVKMTGPEAAVQKELPNFDAFVASLHEASQMPAGHPPVAAANEPAPMAGANTGAMASSPGGTEGAEGITWDVPAGWQRGADKPMRLATYTFGPSNEGDCRLYVFPDMAGGLADNANRWRAQMGLPPQSEDDIAALPKLPVLGREATYLELEGDFTDMQAATQPGYKMLGLICPLEGRSLFIKLTGPKTLVDSQVDEFKSFVSSMR